MDGVRTAQLNISCIGMLVNFWIQGWGPRGLASTSRTARGQNFVALALASKTPGLGLSLGLEDPWSWPWPWPRRCAALTLASRSGRNVTV